MISSDEAFVLPPFGTLFNTSAIPDLGELLKIALSPATAAPEVDIPDFDIDLEDLADSNESTEVTVAGFDFDEITEPEDFIDFGMDEPIEQLPTQLPANDIDFNDAELDDFDDHPEGL